MKTVQVYTPFVWCERCSVCDIVKEEVRDADDNLIGIEYRCGNAPLCKKIIAAEKNSHVYNP